jgi:hypothetical protein
MDSRSISIKYAHTPGLTLIAASGDGDTWNTGGIKHRCFHTRDDDRAPSGPPSTPPPTSGEGASAGLGEQEVLRRMEEVTFNSMGVLPGDMRWPYSTILHELSDHFSNNDAVGLVIIQESNFTSNMIDSNTNKT